MGKQQSISIRRWMIRYLSVLLILLLAGMMRGNEICCFGNGDIQECGHPKDGKTEQSGEEK